VDVGAVLILRERSAGESRVAATPETVRRLRARGLNFQVELGAGLAAGYADQDYADAGASLVEPGAGLGAGVDAVLCVNPPAAAVLEQLKPGALVAGLLAPYGASGLVEQLQARQLSALALELLPRISRAQSMDVLSSQANIAGYKAVLLAAAALDRYVPALATARRLGAVVYVSDVRPAAKEQVESLGGRFVSPPEQEERPAESGGYAKAASEAFLAAQRQQLAEQLALADMVICTAQVPGRRAPLLISEEMVAGMRPGSVVVDLAVAQGGNCAGTVCGQTVERHGVQLIGGDGLPSSVANHASDLYARNLASLVEHVLGEGGFLLDQQLEQEDPIVAGCLLTHAGACRFPDLVSGAN